MSDCARARARAACFSLSILHHRDMRSIREHCMRAHGRPAGSRLEISFCPLMLMLMQTARWTENESIRQYGRATCTP